MASLPFAPEIVLPAIDYFIDELELHDVNPYGFRATINPTYAEKPGTYVNTEGRVQMGDRAAFPPGDAREDWAILRALSGHLGKTLPFDSLAGLRRALYEAYPQFAAIDGLPAGDAGVIGGLAGLGGKTDKAGFVSPVSDFYQTNPIARASAVMAECSALASGRHRQAAE